MICAANIGLFHTCCAVADVPEGCYNLFTMAKNNKQVQYQALSYEAEYSIIKKDLFRVLVLNLVYLALILGLYFSDLKHHYLLNFFTKVFHF